MADSVTQLTALRALRTSVTDPTAIAALDGAIARLEAAIAQAPSPHSMYIKGGAQVGIATSGDIHGGVKTGEHYEALLQVFFQAAGVPQPSDDQRELLASYLDGLARRYDRIRLASMINWKQKGGKESAFTLSQLYVTLASKEWVTIEEADDESAFTKMLLAGSSDKVLPQDERQVTISIGLDKTVDWPTELISAPVQKYTYLQRPLLLTEVLSERRQIVLLGEQGSGKSTFLRFLAVTLARADNEDAVAKVLPGWSAGLLLPVCISLEDFTIWAQQRKLVLNADSLWTYLLVQTEGVALDGLAGQIKRAFRKNRLLLLLDGLDEVNPTLRVEVSMAIAALAEPGGFVVVTCRKRSFINDLAAPLREWGDPIEIATLTIGQIRHFMSQWYTYETEALVGHITLTPSFRKLTETPLLLIIATILHCYVSKLPEDRASLYENLVHLMLSHWTVQRRYPVIPPNLLSQLAVLGLREHHIRNMLEDLAYHAHHCTRLPDGRGLVDESVIRDEMIKMFHQFDIPSGPANEKAELLLTYLTEESCLLLKEDSNKYCLPYLALEEYLAACTLAKKESEFHIVAYRHWQTDPDRWYEVILLALKRMVHTNKQDTVSSWMRFLLLSNHGYQSRDKSEQLLASLFAAECLTAIGYQTALVGTTVIDLPALWDDLALALAQTIEQERLPAENRIRAGELICLLNIDDPRPGVCTLPPAVVPINEGNFAIGISSNEFTELVQSAANDSERNDLQQWYMNAVNDRERKIEAFAITRYLVTNAQYALFIKEKGYDPEQVWWNGAGKVWLQRERKVAPEHWSNSTYGKSRFNYPVVGVSWYEACAFCHWLSLHPIYNPKGYIYRLPSEVEWEYSVRSVERRMYPWGNNNPSGEFANFDNLYRGTSPVGCFSLGATPEGIQDLAGNVWEWTSSNFVPYAKGVVIPSDIKDEREEKSFTIRGGGWFNLPIFLRSFTRNSYPPYKRYGDVGFRIVQQLT